MAADVARKYRFQSTPSARRATEPPCDRLDDLKISIHALREESDVSLVVGLHKPLKISIHALREESDPPAGAEPKRVQRKISIHALREESDA